MTMYSDELAPDAAIDHLGADAVFDPTPVTPSEPNPQTDGLDSAPTTPSGPDEPLRGSEGMSDPAVPEPTDARTCVVCGAVFAGTSPERCESRPDWCGRCCPHSSCHERVAELLT